MIATAILLAALCNPDTIICDATGCRTPTPVIEWTPDAAPAHTLWIREPGTGDAGWGYCGAVAATPPIGTPVQRYCAWEPGYEYEVGVQAVNQYGTSVTVAAIDDMLGGSTVWCWPEWWECDSSGCIGMFAQQEPPPPPPFESIVDNDSPSATRNGYWPTSSPVAPWYGADVRRGYYLDGNTDGINDWHAWEFTLPAAGRYRVEAFWALSTSNSTSVRYDVGVTSFTVNQQLGVAGWNQVAELDLPAGTVIVKVYTNPQGTAQAVRADAVRVTSVP